MFFVCSLFLSELWLILLRRLFSMMFVLKIPHPNSQVSLIISIGGDLKWLCKCKS